MTQSLRQLHNTWSDTVVDYNNALNGMIRAKNELVNALAAHFGIEHAIVGTRKCPDSPISKCVFDRVPDPTYIDCLICHQSQPEEDY